MTLNEHDILELGERAAKEMWLQDSAWIIGFVRRAEQSTTRFIRWLLENRS